MPLVTKTRWLLAEAEAVASRIALAMSPACDRITIAGSIRRRKPEVGDIEVVCIRSPGLAVARALGEGIE